MSNITEEQIKSKIYSNLMKRNEHVVLERMSDEYFSFFLDNISELIQGRILTSAKSVNKFCTKLQLLSSYDRNKCFQGLSEMIFWLYAIRMNYIFEIDKQLHVGNNSDIDIQIVKDGYRFNIEIKTPNQIEKTDESTLNINTPFRSFETKDILEKELQKVNNEVTQAIISNSQGKYSSYKRTKINDNKVIEYLKSGQTKFTYEPDSINVLAMSVPSQHMNDYWGYLCNPFTGIFTDRFVGKFFDKNNIEVRHSDFDKVDVIYLTNTVEGHVRCIKDFDSWKLENYCSIFCINPYSKRIGKSSDTKVYSKLLEILPNDTLEFEKERDAKNRQYEETGISTDPIFFLEYLYNHYKKL